MRAVQVGCAVIEKQGKILIAQRKPGSHQGGFWEFPGGKCREDETMVECLIREASEELGILIEPRIFFHRSGFSYPEKNVDLHFYLCRWVSGRPVRHDCNDFAWVLPEQLRHFQFVAADTQIVNRLSCLRLPDVFFNAQFRSLEGSGKDSSLPNRYICIGTLFNDVK